MRSRPYARSRPGRAVLHATLRYLGRVVLYAVLVGCGDEDTTETPDCSLICTRYVECVEPLDLPKCIDTCEHHASISRVFALAAIDCKHCIDGKTCDEVSQCWDTCPVRPLP